MAGSTVSDLVGKKIGHVEVLGIYRGKIHTKHKGTYWLCKCDCGNVKAIPKTNLMKNNMTGNVSCGCQSHDRSKFRGGISVDNPEYYLWVGMLTRCGHRSNKGHKNYVDRGIVVCERWRNETNGFYNFIKDMGPRPSSKHSVERKDNDGNYEPSNCKWATAKEQNRNQQRNKVWTFNGKTMCLAAWADETGIRRTTLTQREKLGWSIEKMLTTPALIRNLKR